MYHLDYETRNTATDLTEVGAYRYAEDAQIIFASVAKDDNEPLLWVNPEFSSPYVQSDKGAYDLLMGALLSTEPLVAHNAEFEAAITAACGFPRVAPERWRCTAAMARMAGLHADLANLSNDLKLPQAKFASGRALIKKYSCANTEPEADFKEFAEYCKQDVRAEQAVFRALKPFQLHGISLAAFQLTMRINQRGVPVNIPALRNADAVITAELERCGERFAQLTGLKPTQRDAVKEWLMWEGLALPDMQGATLDAAPSVNPVVDEVVGLYRKLSYSAVKKVRTMLDCACKDGRVRGTHLYHGAGTGRWSGRLIQPQNFKKPTIENTDEVYAAVKRGTTLEELELCYGSPFDALSSAIRHFIDSGSPIYDGDYSAVEARIVNWLAGQDDVLASFRAGRDVYKDMAALIYSKPAADVTKAERQLGKAAVLGCGYGMGHVKFKDTCASWGIDISEALSQRTVEVYRFKHERVVAFWYACDRAMKQALKQTTQIQVRGLTFFSTTYQGVPFLLIRLPSGRSLCYPHPKLEIIDEREALTYYGQIPGKQIWGRIKLYGGKIVENAVQAIAADLMTVGAINAERAGFEPFMLVHDQALAPAKGSMKLFEQALTALPEWAAGLPLAAEVVETPYYTK